MPLSDSDEKSAVKATPRRGTRNKKLSLKAQEALCYRQSVDSISSDNVPEPFFESDSEVEAPKPSVLHENEAVSGEKIFSFGNMKRKIGLIEKAAEFHSQIPKTPALVRNKLTKEIKAKLHEEDLSFEEPYSDSGSDAAFTSSESESSETETDESDDEKQPERRTKKQENIPSRQQKPDNRNKKKQNTYVIKTDDYFANHSSKKSITSNHTLDKLETPRLPQDQLQKLLRNMELTKQHTRALNDLNENNKKHFTKWLYLLHENFNMLLYGLGSKRNILKQFQEEISDSPVVVVNGFFPTLSLKDILDSIAVGVLDLKDLPANPYEACEVIEEAFLRQNDLHLYLIVHNIDGEVLRNGKTQSVLAKLAAVKNVHLIASIDHINGPLIWDYRKLSKFNFLWWDVTSYLPYVDETAFENSLLVQKSGTLALSSLKNVFLSLTTNSKGIYMKIVDYQLEHGKNQYYQGIAFKKLYSVCREAFLVSSDLALRAQLTEFVDHKMVKFRRSADGTEYLVIPIANQLLQQFLNEQTK